MNTSFDEFLAKTPSEECRTETVPCALGVRVRLARNLAGFPFPNWANGRRRRDAADKIFAAAETLPEFSEAFGFELSALSPLRRNFLIERRYISPDLAGEASGVIISRSRDVALMVNEEDAVRLQVFAPGNDFGAAWEKARELDRALGANLDFAFSEKYGFLTACPSNAGTGLRVSVMLHLPGFVMEGQLDKMLRALNAVGIAVRGYFGEGSESKGCIFQISNNHTLGISEEETIALMRRWTQDVVEQELAARRRIFARERTPIADRIARAYGNLRFAVSLSSDEAVELLSLLRLGADAGVLAEGSRERLDELSVEMGRAHIECRSAFRGIPCDDSRENLLRGNLFRETLSTIRPPTFPDFLK